MQQIIPQIIPIIVLLMIGYVIQEKQWLSEEIMGGIKKFIVKITLPAVLFMIFLNMELKKEYLAIIFVIILLCMLPYLVGLIINKLKWSSNPMLPFFCTSFSFGLLGVPLYGAIFGIENLDRLSILGMGNELFIWFIYYNLLQIQFSGKGFSKKSIIDVFKSPILLSVIAGIVFNYVGLDKYFNEVAILKGIKGTLQYLMNLATPLMLIIVGYGLKFKKEYMKESVILVVLRMILILVLGYICKWLFIDKIMPKDILFEYAYFTFLILPPPLSLPIFAEMYSGKKYRDLLNNAVVLSTAVSIVVFIIFVFVVS